MDNKGEGFLHKGVLKGRGSHINGYNTAINNKGVDKCFLCD